jgi:hypothetical protein
MSFRQIVADDCSGKPQPFLVTIEFIETLSKAFPSPFTVN